MLTVFIPQHQWFYRIQYAPRTLEYAPRTLEYAPRTLEYARRTLYSDKSHHIESPSLELSHRPPSCPYIILHEPASIVQPRHLILPITASIRKLRLNTLSQNRQRSLIMACQYGVYSALSTL